MPFESRRRARDEKREAVLRTAVQLFLEQGYHGTTLNDVAERLNVTKPALYNYFGGKDEILYECWAIGQERVDDCLDEIASGGGTGLAKLRKLIVSYAEVMTTDYGKSLVRFDVRDLTEHNRKIVQLAKKKIDRAFRDYIKDGYCRRLDQAVRCEAFRLCDRRLAELDRPLVSARRGLVGGRHCRRICDPPHRGARNDQRERRRSSRPAKARDQREYRDEHHPGFKARAADQSERPRHRLRRAAHRLARVGERVARLAAAIRSLGAGEAIASRYSRSIPTAISSSISPPAGPAR